MTTLSKTYLSEDAARQAIEALKAAGAPPGDIRLLTSRPLRDIRREPRGGFAQPVAAEAPVGSYASVPHRRRQAIGSFATGSLAGDPDRERKGSFADVERVVIVTYGNDTERRRVTGYRGAREFLRRAALDDEAVDRAVRQLHTGNAVVLVDSGEITPSDARTHLEQSAYAA